MRDEFCRAGRVRGARLRLAVQLLGIIFLLALSAHVSFPGIPQAFAAVLFSPFLLILQAQNDGLPNAFICVALMMSKADVPHVLIYSLFPLCGSPAPLRALGLRAVFWKPGDAVWGGKMSVLGNPGGHSRVLSSPVKTDRVPFFTH